MRLFSFLIASLVLSSCSSKHDEQADINNCPLLLLKDTSFSTIRTKLESPIDDSLTNNTFTVTYRKDKWYIKDAKNKLIKQAAPRKYVFFIGQLWRMADEDPLNEN